MIITTELNKLVSPIHDRMPAILKPEAKAEWLNLDTTPEQALELLQPYQDTKMRAYEVSRLVNSPNNDVSEVIKNCNVITLRIRGSIPDNNELDVIRRNLKLESQLQQNNSPNHRIGQ